MNKVFLNGNLCKTPELHYTTTGKAICQVNIAVRATEERTDFILLKAWTKTAELLCQYCSKGDKITVEGRLTSEKYQKDGKDAYISYVTIDKLAFGFKPKGVNNEN